MLSVYDVKYPSSSSGVNQIKMHSEKLVIDDVVLIDKEETNNNRANRDDFDKKATVVQRLKGKRTCAAKD